jgi:PKD repeat protein
VYTWTFDIEDAGVNVVDVDVTVDEGKALAGNAQVPRTNTNYIDVDTENPTVTITDITDYVNALASITGTAHDTSPGDIEKVELAIENTVDSQYWDGVSWISNEIWLNTTGTTSWSYDTGPITFADGESYAVKAISTDKAGNTSTPDSDSFTFYKTPVAGFQAAPVNGSSPLTVVFTDESMGNIDTYTWDFGDGQTSEEQNPSYTYDRQGTYTVMLTVAGPGGTAAETKSNLITVEGRSAPGGCTCLLTDDTTPISELLVGWGMICLCLGISYYLVRRARRPGQ